MKYKIDNYHPGDGAFPSHIGLIPDGARRWAKINNADLLYSYKYAMENIIRIVDYLFTEQTKTISVYMSSDYNFRRTKEEVDAICRSEEWFCSVLIPILAENHATKIVAVGQLEHLPDYFVKTIQTVQGSTENKRGTQLNLCIAYNPLREIEKAFVEKHTESSFLDYLEVKDPIDLIIRSSGANLLSNFLPIQAGFARLYFIDKLFNDITITDIREILESFAVLQRLYGN
ncbi:MAG: undecaprenyl diphosphate synthase family protein [Nitrospirota bacterium]